jgi:hypothetical protein
MYGAEVKLSNMRSAFSAKMQVTSFPFTYGIVTKKVSNFSTV